MTWLGGGRRLLATPPPPQALATPPGRTGEPRASLLCQSGRFGHPRSPPPRDPRARGPVLPLGRRSLGHKQRPPPPQPHSQLLPGKPVSAEEDRNLSPRHSAHWPCLRPFSKANHLLPASPGPSLPRPLRRTGPKRGRSTTALALPPRLFVVH